MLKKILNAVIKAAIKLGSKQLTKIKNPLVRRLAVFFVNAGQQIASVFLDDDKDNEAQIKKVVIANTNVAITEGAGLARDRMMQFEDVKLKTALIVYLDGVVDILKVLIDDNPANEAQIKQIFEARKIALLSVSVDLATDKLAELLGQQVSDPVIAEVIQEILEVIGELLPNEE